MSQDSPFRDPERIYNLVSILMLVLTGVVSCVVVMAALAAPARSPRAAQPTLFVLPTSTSTLAGPTANPTWTPSPTATLTSTPTATFTPSPTT
ncbi:MAG TPA: hypothetical protein ENI95_02920, partial [Chloroflexi bacterium]|nr:hypothetical protein [Chloroflexota bacterium]